MKEIAETGLKVMESNNSKGLVTFADDQLLYACERNRVVRVEKSILGHRNKFFQWYIAISDNLEKCHLLENEFPMMTETNKYYNCTDLPSCKSI